MTGDLTDLLVVLERQAEAELAAIEQQRRTEAERVCAQARTDAEVLQRTAIDLAVRTAEQDAARLLAEARLGAAGIRRAAREQALTDVRARVQTRLVALQGTVAENAATIALVDEALEQLPNATTVVVAPRHSALIGTHLAGRTAVQVTSDEAVRDGALLTDDAGRLVDNRVQTRLDNAWPALRGRLSAGWDESATRLPATVLPVAGVAR